MAAETRNGEENYKREYNRLRSLTTDLCIRQKSVSLCENYCLFDTTETSKAFSNAILNYCLLETERPLIITGLVKHTFYNIIPIWGRTVLKHFKINKFSDKK
jgi:hypothetical protein